MSDHAALQGESVCLGADASPVEIARLYLNAHLSPGSRVATLTEYVRNYRTGATVRTRYFVAMRVDKFLNGSPNGAGDEVREITWAIARLLGYRRSRKDGAILQRSACETLQYLSRKLHGEEGDDAGRSLVEVRL